MDFHVRGPIIEFQLGLCRGSRSELLNKFNS